MEAGQEDYVSIHRLVNNELGYGQIGYENLCVRLDLMKLSENYSTIVAKADGTVLGFIGLLRSIAYNVEGEYLQVTAMAVFEDFQNRGVGSQLLAYAEEYAKKYNIQRIVLTSRLHRIKAHSFYKGNGYVIKSYGFKKDI